MFRNEGIHAEVAKRDCHGKIHGEAENVLDVDVMRQNVEVVDEVKCGKKLSHEDALVVLGDLFVSREDWIGLRRA